MIILNNNNVKNIKKKTITIKKTLSGEKTNNNTYLSHPNYEQTMSNMQGKYHIH